MRQLQIVTRVMKPDDMDVAESTTLRINKGWNEFKSGLGGFQHPRPCSDVHPSYLSLRRLSDSLPARPQTTSGHQQGVCQIYSVCKVQWYDVGPPAMERHL
jgi:hypothetical protein